MSVYIERDASVCMCKYVFVHVCLYMSVYVYILYIFTNCSGHIGSNTRSTI